MKELTSCWQYLHTVLNSTFIFNHRFGMEDFLNEVVEIKGMVDAIQSAVLQKVKERCKPMSL